VSDSVIAEGAGIYIFTSDDQALSPHNVLYVGKADGSRQTLRSRLRSYLRRFAKTGGPPSKHAGKEELHEYYCSTPNALYLRWCGVVSARDIEGELIELFDPLFNHKNEHRRGFAHHELIPEDHLYEV
jgi:excinuclease UvrABC nuclease subunit